MRIFTADDSQVVRKRLMSMLSDVEGVEIIGEAGAARDAIASIRRLKPDVVILDIRMPGGGGIMVLEEIKRDGWATKVIMLTNYPYPQYRARCLKAGADYFLDKSAEFERMPDILRQMIAKPR